jgi:hypothetical protein
MPTKTTAKAGLGAWGVEGQRRRRSQGEGSEGYSG